MLLLWIYLSWSVFLVGAELAFAHQNEPAYRQIARSRAHDHAFHEVLAMRAMVRVAVAFLKGEEAPRITDLADELSVPERSIEEVFTKLRDHRILAVAEEDALPAFLPGRDLARITIKNVLDALKGKSGKIAFAPNGTLDVEIDAVLGAYEEEKESSSFNRTLRQLAEECISEGTEEPSLGLAGLGEVAG
jgi:membrane protein